MHTLIVGPRGVGKSTLIRRVLAEIEAPVCGFETKKEDALADPDLGSPIYIYQALQERTQTAENLLGYCKNRHAASFKAAFDRFAPALRAPFPADCVILLDEIGFMEAASEDFCSAVLALLGGDIPVLAAVKNKDIPFLEAVRSHPKAKCFYISEENRDELFPEVLAHLRTQLKKEN